MVSVARELTSTAVCHQSDDMWSTEYCSGLSILRWTGGHGAAGFMKKLSRRACSSQTLEAAQGPQEEGLGRLGLAEDAPGSPS